MLHNSSLHKWKFCSFRDCNRVRSSVGNIRDGRASRDAYKKSPQSDGAKREQGVSRAILAALIAALGPVSFGYCIGYSSSALEDLQNADYSSVVRLSADQGSWFSVGSIMSFS